VEEIADPRIVAIAVNRLSLEVLFVVLQFPLNVRKLRVEFVFFCVSRLAKIALRPAVATEGLRV
jgi:hypothetical protein